MRKTDNVPQNSGQRQHIGGIVIGKTGRDYEESQARIKAQFFKMPYINLFGFPVELTALKAIPRSRAVAADLAPFLLADKEIRLGTTDPKNAKQKQLLESLSAKGFNVQVYFISASSFKHVIDFYANLIKPRKGIKIEVTISAEELEKFKLSVPSLRQLQKQTVGVNVTELIDLLVAAAIQLDASDIHLEPAAKDLRVRYRIDGILHDAATLPKIGQSRLLDRIKLLSKLKLNVKKTAQDGRFTIKNKDRDIDVRVSILPSQYGEAVVMRLLGTGSLLLKIADLGLRGQAASAIEAELRKPNGMILTTGPTGSGKTTTLYSFVNQLNNPDIKIITLEDPIEYRLTGIEQTQVNDQAGYSFAKGLRSILRQDPDVVLVGEIRDLETAETAVSAALTGHIVFSTLHTNDSAGALPRLIDMGVRQFVLAPAINAIIAQRLVRKVCSECFKKITPSKDDLLYIKTILGPELFKKVPKKFNLALPQGCEACHFLGYKGRIGIFEVFQIDDKMEQLILAAASTAEIRAAAIAQGMTLMKQDGVFKAIENITTLEEVERVT